MADTAQNVGQIEVSVTADLTPLLEQLAKLEANGIRIPVEGVLEGTGAPGTARTGPRAVVAPPAAATGAASGGGTASPTFEIPDDLAVRIRGQVEAAFREPFDVALNITNLTEIRKQLGGVELAAPAPSASAAAGHVGAGALSGTQAQTAFRTQIAQLKATKDQIAVFSRSSGDFKTAMASLAQTIESFPAHFGGAALANSAEDPASRAVEIMTRFFPRLRTFDAASENPGGQPLARLVDTLATGVNTAAPEARLPLMGVLANLPLRGAYQQLLAELPAAPHAASTAPPRAPVAPPPPPATPPPSAVHAATAEPPVREPAVTSVNGQPTLRTGTAIGVRGRDAAGNRTGAVTPLTLDELVGMFRGFGAISSTGIRSPQGFSSADFDYDPKLGRLLSQREVQDRRQKGRMQVAIGPSGFNYGNALDLLAHSPTFHNVAEIMDTNHRRGTGQFVHYDPAEESDEVQRLLRTGKGYLNLAGTGEAPNDAYVRRVAPSRLFDEVFRQLVPSTEHETPAGQPSFFSRVVSKLATGYLGTPSVVRPDAEAGDRSGFVKLSPSLQSYAQHDLAGSARLDRVDQLLEQALKRQEGLAGSGRPTDIIDKRVNDLIEEYNRLAGLGATMPEHRAAMGDATDIPRTADPTRPLTSTSGSGVVDARMRAIRTRAEAERGQRAAQRANVGAGGGKSDWEKREEAEAAGAKRDALSGLYYSGPGSEHIARGAQVLEDLRTGTLMPNGLNSDPFMARGQSGEVALAGDRPQGTIGFVRSQFEAILDDARQQYKDDLPAGLEQELSAMRRAAIDTIVNPGIGGAAMPGGSHARGKTFAEQDLVAAESARKAAAGRQKAINDTPLGKALIAAREAGRQVAIGGGAQAGTVRLRALPTPDAAATLAALREQPEMGGLLDRLNAFPNLIGEAMGFREPGAATIEELTPAQKRTAGEQSEGIEAERRRLAGLRSTPGARPRDARIPAPVERSEVVDTVRTMLSLERMAKEQATGALAPGGASEVSSLEGKAARLAELLGTTFALPEHAQLPSLAVSGIDPLVAASAAQIITRRQAHEARARKQGFTPDVNPFLGGDEGRAAASGPGLVPGLGGSADAFVRSLGGKPLEDPFAARPIGGTPVRPRGAEQLELFNQIPETPALGAAPPWTAPGQQGPGGPNGPGSTSSGPMGSGARVHVWVDGGEIMVTGGGAGVGGAARGSAGHARGEAQFARADMAAVHAPWMVTAAQKHTQALREQGFTDAQIRASFKASDNSYARQLGELTLSPAEPGAGAGGNFSVGTNAAIAAFRKSGAAMPNLGDVRARPDDPLSVSIDAQMRGAAGKMQSRSISTSLVSIFENMFGGRQGPITRLMGAQDLRQQFQKRQDDATFLGESLAKAQAHLEKKKAEYGPTPTAKQQTKLTDLGEKLQTLRDAFDTTTTEAGKLGEAAADAAKGAVGMSDVMRNLGAGAVGGVAGVMAGGAIAMVAQTVAGGLSQALGPMIERATGYGSTTQRVTAQLGAAVAGRGGDPNAVAGALASSGISAAAFAALSPDLTLRAQTETGNTNLKAQYDALNTSRRVAQQNAGLGLFDKGLFATTGGFSALGIDTVIGGVPSTQELIGQQLDSSVFDKTLTGADRVRIAGASTQGIQTQIDELTSTMNGVGPDSEMGKSIASDIAKLQAQMTPIDPSKIVQSTRGDDFLKLLAEQTKRGGSDVTLGRSTDDKEIARSADLAHQAGLDTLRDKITQQGLAFSGAASSQDVLQWEMAANKGAQTPSSDLLLWDQRRQLAAQKAMEGKQLGLANATAPMQWSMAQAVNPVGNLAAPLAAMGAAVPKELTGALRTIGDDAKTGLAEAKQFIVGTLPDMPQAGADFASAMNKAAGYGTQISKLGIGAETAQATFQAHQWSFELYQGNRALSDAKGLAGEITKAGGNNLGVIERQNFELNRQAQLLGFAHSQRQINFAVAMAGFVAPGVTSEERAARIKEAKLEADYNQKNLDISEKLAANAKTGFTIGASRGLTDATRQIALAQEGIRTQKTVTSAEKTIAALTLLQQKEVTRSSNIFSVAENRANELIAKAGEIAAASGEALAEVGNKVLKEFGIEYGLMIDIINGTPVQTGHAESGSGSSSSGSSSGGSKPTPPPTPQKPTGSTRDSSTHITIAVTGTTNPDAVAAAVERRLSRKLALLGGRSVGF